MKRSPRIRSKHRAEWHPSIPGGYQRDVESVAFFNDAVFAIAMTLLVFGIRVPAGTTASSLGNALRRLGPAFSSYGASFIVIGLYWLGYHRQVRFMERFDGPALVIDLVFLMSVSFLPFPTLLLNRYYGSVSVVFYASSIAVAGILLAALWIYAGRRQLLKGIDRRLNTYFILRAFLVPLVFLLSVPVAVGAPGVAPYIWLLVFLGQPVLRRVVYR